MYLHVIPGFPLHHLRYPQVYLKESQNDKNLSFLDFQIYRYSHAYQKQYHKLILRGKKLFKLILK